jgi:hypothetical protein
MSQPSSFTHYASRITHHLSHLTLSASRIPPPLQYSLAPIPHSALLAIALLLFPSIVRAHAPSDTFLHFDLTPTNLNASWEVKLVDLQHALGFDKPDAATIPPPQLRAREEALALDTVGALNLKLDGKTIPLEVIDEQIVTRRDGDALLLNLKSENWQQLPSDVELHAEVLFALDPQIRCVLRLEYWGAPQQTILSADHPVFKLSLRAPPSRAQQLLAFIREGIWHIWTGYDHILFLISLLLPAVLIWHSPFKKLPITNSPESATRHSTPPSLHHSHSALSSPPNDQLPIPPAPPPGPASRITLQSSSQNLKSEIPDLKSPSWTGAPALKPALINVLKIVTAFTIAHSITLALAALHVVQLPTRWIESAIAASVIAAALNNLWPVVRERSWLVAFAFGLIHGFGFANVLAEAGLTKASLTIALIGFNLGVEIGQLAIVISLVPFAYRFRHTRAYIQIILRGGSTLVIAIATIWLLERLFNFKFLPF